ncbi:MAG: crossover junction endodeoxyribonuclease RuvC [Thermoleophilia bacterium]|jgi:crossover junction endodeoxyribonuclease RuvC|nr:crossover junction endodeoxyribonuclease RuvC [Thermoleophilia bacterium]
MILGLDPGTAATGYGVIEQRGARLAAVAYGVIETPAGMQLHHRLDIIFRHVAAVLDRYRPEAAAVESLFFNVNVRTALAVGQARGVALLACSRSGCDLFEYTPQQVKLAVVGYGKAEKAQVQEMVRVLLSLDHTPSPDHAADALGVAICHAHGARMRDGVNRALAAARRGPAGGVERSRP